MKHFGLDKKGQKLAVVGLGGLGHMAVKFGKGEPLISTFCADVPSLSCVFKAVHPCQVWQV